MIEIEFENIVLRDMIESDIGDYVRWFTVEREWENWDAPWEKEDTDEETERKKWMEYYQSVKKRTDDNLRYKFEIDYSGTHIGWVSAYNIDENYDWIESSNDHKPVYIAIGIDICEPDFYGKGIGTKALSVFINYYFEKGFNELYTQTWSGNARMIRCAEKLGFVECCRKAGKREIDGQKYDALTFKLEYESIESGI